MKRKKKASHHSQVWPFLCLLVKELGRVCQLKQPSVSMSLVNKVVFSHLNNVLVARIQTNKQMKTGVCPLVYVHACMCVLVFAYVCMYTLDFLMLVLRALLTLKSTCLTSLCTSNFFKAKGISSRRISFQLKASKLNVRNSLFLSFFLIFLLP